MELVIKHEYHFYFFCAVTGIPILVYIIIAIYTYIIMNRPVSRKPTYSEKIIANHKAKKRLISTTEGKTLTADEESYRKASKERINSDIVIENDQISEAQTMIPVEPTVMTANEPITEKELQEDVIVKIAAEEEYSNLEFQTPKLTAKEPTRRASKETIDTGAEYAKFESQPTIA